jgi:hypothetical protein
MPGLATPIFEEIGMRLRVTLFTTQVQEPTFDKLDAAIVSPVRAADGLATHEAAKKSASPLAPGSRISLLAGWCANWAPGRKTRDAATIAKNGNRNPLYEFMREVAPGSGVNVGAFSQGQRRYLNFDRENVLRMARGIASPDGNR